MTMTSSRAYVMRALYEWILDNQCTPYVLVDAGGVGVEVPQYYVKDGQIVLNIAPSAVADLLIGNDAMQFSGRFGGVPMNVHVPIPSIMGIYARENGRGMIFDLDEHHDSVEEKSEIKPAIKPEIKSVSDLQDEPENPPPTSPAPGPGSRPSLRVVK